MAKKSKKQPGGTPATVALTAAWTAFTVHAYDHDPASPSYGRKPPRPWASPPTGSSRPWWRTWTAP